MAIDGLLDPSPGADPQAASDVESAKLEGASPSSFLKPMGQRLAVGQFRKSPNGSYMLFQQEDGNLVLRDAAGKAIWSNSVTGKGVATHMQADGNVVSRSSSGNPLWHTQTNPGRGCFLLVQNDGNLVLFNADLKVIWTR